MKPRLGRIQYYMGIAQLVSLRGTCPKATVGAILVNPYTNHIVATGYNGSMKGTPHCLDVGCLEIESNTGHGKSCIRTVHAEMNAIIQLEKSYSSLVLYCTHQPCYQCFKALVNAGVKSMYFIHPYKDTMRDALWNESDTEMFLVEWDGKEVGNECKKLDRNKK